MCNHKGASAGAWQPSFREEPGMNRQVNQSRHAVVIPLYGNEPINAVLNYIRELLVAGLLVVLVDNNLDPCPHLDSVSIDCPIVLNQNRGGIAGGLNRGIEYARHAGAEWITLLDQDSRIRADQIHRLREPFAELPQQRMVVGPCIWDQQHQKRHGRWIASPHNFDSTRLLITSGTTFRTSDWPDLGCFHEGLFVDFVDHAWCFRAQARGFALFQHPGVILEQHFGAVHPNRICRRIGMRLYSPSRHFYGLRNLRWLCLQPYVPLDLKLKEVFKMLFKPYLWLLFEPRRRANLRAIFMALLARLPDPY
jgi:rhamnosyltransferase